MLILSYNISHFVPVFKKIDEKLAQIKGIFYSNVLRNYTENLSYF